MWTLDGKEVTVRELIDAAREEGYKGSEKNPGAFNVHEAAEFLRGKGKNVEEE